MKNIILILFTILLSYTATAQKLKVVEATQRTWKSYMCCQYGIYYDVTLESNDTLQTLEFDTLWYGDEYYVQYQSRFYTLTKNIVNGKACYYFHISLSWDNNSSDIVDNVTFIKPPPYNGVACLFYNADKKRKRVDIDEFKVTPPIGSL